jgi:hypothetical protein
MFGTSLDRVDHSLELTFFSMTARETPDVPAIPPFMIEEEGPLSRRPRLRT